MVTRVLFHPFVTVVTDDYGNRYLEWDWFDTCQGTVTEDGSVISERTPTVVAAEDYMDRFIEDGTLTPLSATN